MCWFSRLSKAGTDNHLRTVNKSALPDSQSDIVNKMIEAIDKNQNTPDLTNTIFWRARKHGSDQLCAYPEDRMSAPPVHLSKAGRISPEGVPGLYLSDSVDTAIAENRPWKGANLSVASFQLLKKHKLAYLRRSEMVAEILHVGKRIPVSAVQSLSFMASSFSKPVGSESADDYVPTQFFSDRLKLLGYEGLVYDSMMYEGGYNLALFDPSNGVSLMGKVEVYYVTKVQYAFNKY